MKKTTVADRTVPMFAPPELHTDDAKDKPRLSENIEQAAERWRNNAFFTQELVSKSYQDNIPNTAKFRITVKDGWSYLEQLRLGKDGMAYSYSGLMFRESDLYELTGVFVKASKARQAKSE